jgi:hypothetical protein
MPYTEKQRKFLNYAKEHPRDAGIPADDAARMANEANRLKGEDKERKPVSKANFTDLTPIFRPR